jgi:hypothetical protein
VGLIKKRASSSLEAFTQAEERAHAGFLEDFDAALALVKRVRNAAATRAKDLEELSLVAKARAAVLWEDFNE